MEFNNMIQQGALREPEGDEWRHMCTLIWCADGAPN
jgi:hypothetical protein